MALANSGCPGKGQKMIVVVCVGGLDTISNHRQKFTPETKVFPDSDGDRSRLMMSPI